MSGCDPDLIACQISTVTEAIGSWNWNSFVSTVIATAIGGLIGLAGVWWGFRLQRSHRYREVLDDSVVEAIDALATYARGASEYHEKFLRHKAALIAGGIVVSTPSEPDPTTVSIRLTVVEMRARDADQDLVSEAIRSFDQICEMLDFQTRAGRCGVLAGALSRWRSGIWDEEQVRGSVRRSGLLPGTEDVVDVEDGS